MTRERAWIKHINDKGLNSSPIDFEAGFIAGLDHSAAQIAALEAALRQAQAALRQALRQAQDSAQDERERLREAQFKHTKALKRMVKTWRSRASGHYCQTYNPGMAQGLNGAAGMLEEYVNEAWREPET